MIEVREYVDGKGKSPFAKWLRSLNVVAAAKVTAALERIAAGNFSSIKGVGESVLEYRIDFGPGYRVYFGKDGERLISCWPVVRRSGSRTTSKPPRRTGKTINCAKLKEKQMPLTKDFRETVRQRARNEPAFRRALLQEAIELMLTGDVTTGKALIRNYINATVGFQDLARAVHTSAPSLLRMFGPKGNPSAKNLFGVIAHLQKHEGVNFALRSVRQS